MPLSRQTGVVDPEDATAGPQPAETDAVQSDSDPRHRSDGDPRPGDRAAGRRLAAGPARRRMVGLGLRRRSRRPAAHPRRGGGGRRRAARHAGRLLARRYARPRHRRLRRRAAAGLAEPAGAAADRGPASARTGPAPNRWSSASTTGGGWRVGAGIAEDRVLDLDLDHLTDDSRDRLIRLLGYSEATRPWRSVISTGRSISSWSMRPAGRGRPAWPNRPSCSAPSPALYGGGRQAWRDLLRARLSGGMPRLNELRESSRRMVDLLPARLRDTALARRRRRRRGARLHRRRDPGRSRRDRRAAGLGRGRSGAVGAHRHRAAPEAE